MLKHLRFDIFELQETKSPVRPIKATNEQRIETGTGNISIEGKRGYQRCFHRTGQWGSKRILFSDEAHFWLNGYVNKQNCRIWSEANPQVYVEAPLHPEKLTVWCALWAGGILLQKR
ncbi:putative transposase [Trichonephila clavipes]|nr:putative transposase [Trichonephila clavipes]